MTGRGTSQAPRRAGRWAAVVAATLLGLVTAAPAVALPPDGAGPDTPGTSASVSPRTLEACQTLSFSVSGFPAGETLYVKIDDGVGYGDTSVQGSGVWHMQAISSAGTVNGSFELPCDIAPGAHWLRFLASEELTDASGSYQGVLGYTRRGGADFTVVAPRAGGSSGSGTSPGAGSGSGSGSGTSGSSGAGSGSAGAGASSGSAANGAAAGGQAPAAGESVGSGAEQATGQGGVIAIDPQAAGAAPATTPDPPAATGARLPDETAVAISAVLDGTDAQLALGTGLAGEWVYVYAYSEPAGLGWQQVDEDGIVTVAVADLEPGEHRLAVLDADGELLGWTALEVAEPVAEQSPAPSPAAEPSPTAVAQQDEGSGPPVVGIAVGAAILVVAGGATVVMLRGRRGSAPAPTAGD